MDIEQWERDGRTRKRMRRLLHHVSFYFTWSMTVVLMIFLVLTAWALRSNNLQMIEHSQRVVWADQYGSTAELEAALNTLQDYVGHHMNTSLGSIGIALQHTYDRAVQKAVAESVQSQQLDIPPEVYAQYDAACASQLAAGEWHYTNCISSHIDYQGKNFDFSAPKLPLPELYYVNFTPPHLSLDLAGILVIIDFLLLLFIVCRLAFNLILRLIIKIKFKKVGKNY
jgi:hypothetical protein